MKLLVQTTGAFQFYLPGPEQFVRSEGASVVRQSTFISTHVAKGSIEILGQVTDEATDEGFLAFKGTAAEYLAKFAEKPAKPAKAAAAE